MLRLPSDCPLACHASRSTMYALAMQRLSQTPPLLVRPRVRTGLSLSHSLPPRVIHSMHALGSSSVLKRPPLVRPGVGLLLVPSPPSDRIAKWQLKLYRPVVRAGVATPTLQLDLAAGFRVGAYTVQV